LIFHDLRSTPARNLRQADIRETAIMKIGGWRTRSVSERYAIVSRTDIADASQNRDGGTRLPGVNLYGWSRIAVSHPFAEREKGWGTVRVLAGSKAEYLQK
jgi:hypothetical protein